MSTTTINFTMKDLDGTVVPLTDFVISSGRLNTGEIPDVLPADLEFTTDDDGQATVVLEVTDAPYYITKQDGTTDTFISYKFFVPFSATPLDAELLYVDLGKLSTGWNDKSVAALIEAKVVAVTARNQALQLARVLGTIEDIQSTFDKVNAVGENIVNVNTVGDSIASVNAVAANIASVNTVSANISAINTCSTDIDKIIATANDLNEAVSEIEVVANNIENVNAVGNNIINLNIVANNIDEVAAVGAAVEQAVDGVKDLFVAGTHYTKDGTSNIGLSNTPAKPNTVKVFFDGVYQNKDTYYTVGNILYFGVIGTPALIPADTVEVQYEVASQFVGLTIEDQALLTEIATDALEIRTDLAESTGSSLVGYDGGTAQDVLDSAKPMQSYSDLRAYTGRATAVRITTPGIAGFFQRDGDVATADNGGTVIVDASGRRWKRVFDGPVYLSWFQVPEAPSNSTAGLQNAINAANAMYLSTGAQTELVFPPARTYLIDEVTLKSGVYIAGRSSKITPTSATTGRLVGTDIYSLRIRGLKFEQTPGVNYMPAIYIQSGSDFDLEYCDFTGCGYGCRTLLVNNVTYLRNTLKQVGVYPRPAGAFVGWESQTGADNVKKFKAAYNRYGTGLRSEQGYNINFEHNYFENELFASGCLEDWDGGAGAFSAYRCDDVTFLEGSAINPPGQGYLSAGSWEGTAVPTNILAGSFNYNLLGKNIRFIAPYARGCNQEGVTSYGCGKVTFNGVISEDNAMAALEVWSSWSVTVDGGVLENKVKHAGMTPGPVGAYNIVDSFGVTSSNVLIKETRNSGIRVGGSYNVQINGGSILDYGTDDLTDGLYASGVVLLVGSAVANMSDEVSVTGVTFGRKVRANNTGTDIFVNTTDPALAHDFAGSRAIGRNVTINSGGLTSWQSETYYTRDATGYLWGNTARRPIGAIRGQRTVDVSTTAKAILSLANIAPAITGSDAFLVLVNGTRNDAANQTFADLVLVLGNGTPTVISAVGNTSPPTRTYTVSDGSLMLAMQVNTFSVRASAFATGNGLTT